MGTMTVSLNGSIIGDLSGFSRGDVNRFYRSRIDVFLAGVRRLYYDIDFHADISENNVSRLSGHLLGVDINELGKLHR